MGCAGGDKLLGKWNKLRLVAVFGSEGDVRAPKVKFARWLRSRRGSKRSLRPAVFFIFHKPNRGGCTFSGERDTVALPLFPSLLLLLLGWRRGLLAVRSRPTSRSGARQLFGIREQLGGRKTIYRKTSLRRKRMGIRRSCSRGSPCRGQRRATCSRGQQAV